MKGVVFSKLLDHIETNYGHDVLEKILIEKDSLQSKGIFVSGGTYPHSDFVLLIQSLSKVINKPYNHILLNYGRSSFKDFIAIRPDFKDGCNTCLDFIEIVDQIIHAEVLKLYPDAELPKFDVVNRSKTALTIDYNSKRNMVDFAEGLMHGCADYFQESIEIKLNQINTNGIEWTRFNINLI